MRTLAGLCTRYPSVRVVGGNLLAVEGVRIGRYERGKERMSPVFDCVYDTFVETSLNDLSGIEEKVRKAKSSISSLEKKGGKKKSNDDPKVSKRVKGLSDMLGGVLALLRFIRVCLSFLVRRFSILGLLYLSRLRGLGENFYTGCGCGRWSFG